MKCNKLIIFILIVFFKTGNVLSNENIFNVNNIELLKKPDISNSELANMAIKKGFKDLTGKILLDKDKKKLTSLKFEEVKELVLYYQVSSKIDDKNQNKLFYNIFFDKEKIHKLFYDKNIFYSEAINNEIYLLPILKKNNQIFVYNKNYFYENWNKVYENDFIEFILPIENIEIIQTINSNKDNLLDLNLKNLFQEYTNKDLALIFIVFEGNKNDKIYLRANILGKNIDKNILVDKKDLSEKKYFEKIIIKTGEEIINIVKSQNLIDIRTPSFLNTKLLLDKKNNLVELNKRLKKIDLIDDVYIQELNKDYVTLKIKYLGKIDKIIRQLKSNKIILKLKNEEWSLRII